MAESLGSQGELDQVPGRQEIYCHPCKKKNKDSVAELFCKTCRQYQCEKCSKGHDIYDFMSGHDIVPAEEANAIKPRLDLKGMDMCKDHNKRFEVFCSDHDMLCCNTCVHVSHGSCSNMHDIAGITEQTDTSDVELEVVKLQESANNLIAVLEETKRSTPDKPHSLLDYIDEIKATVINKLDYLKMITSEQFKQEKSILIPVLDKNLLTARVVKSELQQKKEILKTAKESGTAKQNFIVSKITKAHMTQYERALADQKAKSYQILKADLDLASIKIDKEPIDFLSPEVNKAAQLKLVTWVNLNKGQDDTGIPLYSAMDFLPDGRLVVVDTENYKMYVKDKNIENIGMFKFKKKPFCLTVVSEKEVAVTTGNSFRLAFFNVSKTNQISLTRTIKASTSYVSISLMNETTFLVSTFDDKRPLRMITLTGEKKDFDDLPENKYGFGQSRSTYIRNKGVAVLTDKSANTVYMYNVENEGITKKHILKHGSIKQPRTVCEGYSDNLFLCSEATNNIVQVALSGKVIGIHKIDSNPYTVCVSTDGKALAVTNGLGFDRKLQLFRILY